MRRVWLRNSRRREKRIMICMRSLAVLALVGLMLMPSFADSHGAYASNGLQERISQAPTRPPLDPEVCLTPEEAQDIVEALERGEKAAEALAAAEAYIEALKSSAKLQAEILEAQRSLLAEERKAREARTEEARLLRQEADGLRAELARKEAGGKMRAFLGRIKDIGLVLLGTLF